jgi:hypothetical protein
MRSSQLGAILMAVTLLVYLNSFPGAFHYDDFPLLLDNPRVSGPDFAYSSYLDHYAGRPLTLWTLHWNYRFFGDNPLSYHLVSVLLHAFVVLQIFLLVFQLYNQRLLAFSTALLFAVHPLQTQAVNYIWSRSVLLMATFGFAALLSARKRPWVALFCFQLAIWSRTEGLILLVPLLILSRPRWRKLSVLAMVNLVGFVYSMSAYAPVKVAWNYPHPFARAHRFLEVFVDDDVARRLKSRSPHGLSGARVESVWVPCTFGSPGSGLPLEEGLPDTQLGNLLAGSDAGSLAADAEYRHIERKPCLYELCRIRPGGWLVVLKPVAQPSHWVQSVSGLAHSCVAGADDPGPQPSLER